MSGAKQVESTWIKSPVANLYQYRPTGGYYARPRVKGKIISKTLKTDKLHVAKLRLADFLKGINYRVAVQGNFLKGKMTFGMAAQEFKAQLEANQKLKPRSKNYRLERLKAIEKSWPELGRMDIAKITKADCEAWSRNFGKASSAQAFNNTVGTLRMIFDIAINAGARYDNPASRIEKHAIRSKKLTLPSKQQFLDLVRMVESVGVGRTRYCAELIQFLAYGGFRKSEAKYVTWADCDFEKGQICVKGDPITGTKNGEVRNVPMIPEMVALLKKIQGINKDLKNDARVMRVVECQGAITSACKALDIPRFTHHDLRHLFATRCIESGVDIPTVSKWLGHKDGGGLAMKTYGHLRNEHSINMAKLVSFGGNLNESGTPPKTA